MIISLGIEISIASGGANKTDEGNKGLFYIFWFLRHICMVKVQVIG